jgi:Icc protein
MAWAGAGMLWTITGGVLASKILSPSRAAAAYAMGMCADFSFAQISDSHIGFTHVS